MYKLPKLFCPSFKTKLVRLGRNNDGGYCIPEKALRRSKVLISFGLDEDWSFEEDFRKETSAKILCFDSSVNYKFWIKRLIKSIVYFDFKKNYLEQFKKVFNFFKYKFFFEKKNIFHIKKHITSKKIILPKEEQKNFNNLKDIINTWCENDFFIKMDIEGNEYRVLDDILENQKNLTGLVIEFHECDLMYEKIKTFIDKLNLDLVHMHVNNFCTVGKDNFPTVLELTFSPKDNNYKRNDNEFNFPNKEIDQPNDKNGVDKEIVFY